MFKDVGRNDWLFCSWRSHYQCLLKGVPREQVMAEIVAGRSISLCFPEHRIYSSAIVGGVLPIAVGTAMAIQRRGEDARVHCFMGEMTAETGIAHEAIKYSRNHRLPIRFIVEDNDKSVCTDTREAWNQPSLSFENQRDDYIQLLPLPDPLSARRRRRAGAVLRGAMNYFDELKRSMEFLATDPRVVFMGQAVACPAPR